MSTHMGYENEIIFRRRYLCHKGGSIPLLPPVCILRLNIDKAGVCICANRECISRPELYALWGVVGSCSIISARYRRQISAEYHGTPVNIG